MSKLKITAGWLLQTLRSPSFDPYKDEVLGVMEDDGQPMTVREAIAVLETMDPNTIVNEDE